MRTKIFYEWDIEQFDPETDDIIDHNHSDSCPGIPSESGFRLVLVKDVCEVLPNGEPVDIRERAWAYEKDGQLPVNFDDGYPVPKRFQVELDKSK